MAERSVVVKLSAKVDAYVNAMNEAKRATDGLSKESQANLQKLGTSMVGVGKTMTAGVTLPIVGAGVAAVKLGSDFNSAFGQMVGLAGVPAGEVDALKQSVLDLSGETARSPIELAEALYFAASAGLDSAEAMDAVGVAAKASAAGMGSTQDVVGLVASAVASYGAENITAAEATDILTASIREGRAEPAELASTLGRVLPIASQLGVSFDEVGGTVAYLSNVFGDTNRTVTATQGLFVKLVSPTQQGRDALRDMGTSVEELQAAIDQDGLMGALDLLREKGFAGNATALRALFDDIEGYQAALALLNADQADLTGILEATATAAGATDQAFAALDKDTQAMKQAWADLQVAMIQVGAVLGPIVADLAGGVSDLAGWFTDLDPTLQKIIIGVAALGAAAGPLLIVTGSLIRNLNSINMAMSKMDVSAKRATGVMVGLSAVITAAALVYDAYTSDKNRAKQATDDFVSALQAESAGQRDATAQLIAGKLATDDYTKLIDGLGLSASDLAAFIRGESVPAIDELNSKLGGGEYQAVLLSAMDKTNDLEDATGLTGERMGELVAELETLRDSFAAASEVTDRQTAITDELTGVTDQATAASGRRHSSLRNEEVATADMVAAAERHAAVEAEVKKAIEESHQALEELADQLREAADAQLELIDARRSAVDATYALRDAEDDFTSAVEDVNDVLEDSDSTLRDVRQALDSANQAAQGVADAHVRLADETAAAEGRMISATERIDIMNDSLLAQAATLEGPARAALVEHIAQLNGIPPEVASEILALIDEGDLAAAESKLANVSRARSASVTADALTADAEAALSALERDRFVRFNAVGGAFKYAGGTDFHPGGFAILGDGGGPELAWLPRGTAVSTASETRAILSGRMTAMPPGAPAQAPAPAAVASQSSTVQFGDTYVTEREDVDAMFAKANVALTLMGG